MMPMVTVWPTPSGLPIASTTSPTCTASELPSASAGSPSAVTLSSATSLGLSVPTTAAGSVRPSGNSTVMLSAPSITWLFVTM
jgi:hypothetical protein